MKTVQRADTTELPIGTVLLVDTKNTCWKLIVEQDATYVSSLDANTEEEEEHGVLANPNIVVGELLYGLNQNTSSVSKNCTAKILESSQIKNIEIYE